MWGRDRLDGLRDDEDFAGWYPREGWPGISPAQLATVSVLQFLLVLSRPRGCRGGGLRFLKDRLGPRLQESVIFYTGEYAYQQDGWIWILPLSQLWTFTQRA